MDVSGELTAAITALSSQIASSTHKTDVCLHQLADEVKELRDTRMRPYVVSLALFVPLLISITSYIYTTEMSIADTVTSLRDRVHGLELEDAHDDEKHSRLTANVIELQRSRNKSLEELLYRITNEGRSGSSDD
jgi:hypothetical protein